MKLPQFFRLLAQALAPLAPLAPFSDLLTDVFTTPSGNMTEGSTVHFSDIVRVNSGKSTVITRSFEGTPWTDVEGEDDEA